MLTQKLLLEQLWRQISFRSAAKCSPNGRSKGVWKEEECQLGKSRRMQTHNSLQLLRKVESAELGGDGKKGREM